MVLPKYHMIEFTEWMSLREAKKAEAATCPKCGEPTSKENCWNKGKNDYGPPMTTPELKGGRRVIHKPGILGG